MSGSADDWIRGLLDWRGEHPIRIGHDDADYRRPAVGSCTPDELQRLRACGAAF